ncbi:tetratricopeptide repeat protein [Chitinophaga sp. 30R24]|uniref:tetratricopeptide repeat protein n=1 Tax=Chitinophaga sp. 30R24 TaxID=3248838 RepID=UPI003B90EA36
MNRLLCFFFCLAFPGVLAAQEVRTITAEETTKLLKVKPDSAFFYIKNALTLALNNKDEKKVAICYQQIGKVFYTQSDYLHALDYYFKADKILRTQNDPLPFGENLIRIGETYYYSKKRNEALPVFNEALAVFQKAHYKSGIAQTYAWIGQAYNKKGAYDQALKYQQLALELYLQLNDTSGIAKVYENIGSNFEDTEDYQQALRYFELSLTLNHSQNDRVDETEILNNIGDIYRKTGHYEEALIATKKAEKLAAELKDQFQLRSAYHDLAKNYHLMGQNDSAFYYSELDRKIYLEIYEEAKDKQMALLQVQFNVDKKDNEIIKLEKDKQLNRLLAIATLLAIALLTFLGLSIFSKQRTKIKHEQELNDKNKKLHAMEKNVIEIELQHKLSEERNLKDLLELKNKELTSHTLHLIKKDQLLEELKNKLTTLVKEDKRDQRKELKQLVGILNDGSQQDKNWDDFKVVFEQVHEHFFDRLRTYCNTLTAYDLRLVALLKINLSPADIASFLGISPDSLRVSRYRLRRKLNLKEGENLVAFIQQI